MIFLRQLTGRRPLRRSAFLVHTPEIANHFAPIWDALGDRPFDILLHGDATLPDALMSKPWASSVRPVEDVLASGACYEVLVSNHVVDLAVGTGKRKEPLIKLAGAVNLRMMYAAGKSGWNLSDWNRLYDGILCFGPKHARAFSEQFGLPTFQMGYPRFDRFFNETADLQALRARFGCDPDKPVVVWLPTWKALSSVDHFNADIAALTDRFNVVAKVHPLMPEDEPARVAPLAELGLAALITDATDNLPLYQIADYMLFDYGGPAFAGIYTDKRFVLLNVPDAASDAFTGAASPDVLLRRDLVNVDPGDGRLADLLRDGPHWQEHRTTTARLRSDVFAENFGTSAASAAKAITDLSWLGWKGKLRW